MADPYPKSRQLARGERRYRRKVASPKQWQAIIEAKGNRCRLWHEAPLHAPTLEYHHLVSRAALGDDVADNIVPLCAWHHQMVTEQDATALRKLAENLTDAEYAYVVGKLGEGAMGRLFGV